MTVTALINILMKSGSVYSYSVLDEYAQNFRTFAFEPGDTVTFQATGVLTTIEIDQVESIAIDGKTIYEAAE